MPNPCWAERVNDELARRDVPAGYRRRLLAELREHANDLMEEEGVTMMTDEVLTTRLGDAGWLAAQAAQEYRRGRWASRHPFLVFALLPLPVTLLAFAGTLLLFGLVASGLAWLWVGDVDDLPRPAAVALAYGLAGGVRFATFAVVAVLFTRLYLRSWVSGGWFAAAAAQVLIVAGTLISELRYSEEPGQSVWVFGFAWMPAVLGEGWSLPLLSSMGGMQVVQVAVPVAVGAWMFYKARCRQVTVAFSR